MEKVDEKLYREIEDYCNLNEIDISKTLNDALRSGFTILKFGMTPNTPKVKEKVVEVIKEVITEKIVKVSDDIKINELLKRIEKLENEKNKLEINLNKRGVKEKDIYGED